MFPELLLLNIKSIVMFPVYHEHILELSPISSWIRTKMKSMLNNHAKVESLYHSNKTVKHVLCLTIYRTF